MAESERSESSETADWSAFHGVLIVVEQRACVAKKVSWQLLGQGRKIADKLGVPLYALVMGHQVEHLAQEAIGYGADQVFWSDADCLEQYRTRPYSRIVLKVIDQFKPEIVLYGATATGRDLAGAVATHLPTGLTADCTELDVEPDPSRLLLASRPAFSEKMMATILCKRYRPQMATARAGVFEELPYQADRIGKIIPVECPLSESDIAARVIDFFQDQNRVNIEEAEIIVAGGRGIGGVEGFKLLQELAYALKGVIGASRAAVDAGWIKHEHQIGQTGFTVRPKVYFAIGISGAVQHVVGMQNSNLIIAINRDKEAPIFKVADFGIVGDLYTIVPAITAAVREKRGLVNGLEVATAEC